MWSKSTNRKKIQGTRKILAIGINISIESSAISHLQKEFSLYKFYLLGPDYLLN